MKIQSLGVPVAIVIAAALIAGAIYLSGRTSAPQPTDASPTAQRNEPFVAPVTADDHIKGNPNAPIVFIEYSDFDCPFCRQFHDTMNTVMNEYGIDGRVAWVYRHFPIVSRHPNAIRVAEASECAAELGGNDAFWAFSDLAFGQRGGINDPTDISRLSEFAVASGVDERQFTTCLQSGRYTQQILADIEEAMAAGAEGTPHVVVIAGDEQGVINGAQPYEVMVSIIENLLSQMEATDVAS